MRFSGSSVEISSNTNFIVNEQIGIGTKSPLAGLHLKGQEILMTNLGGMQQFKVSNTGVIQTRGLLIKDANGQNQLSISNDGFVVARQIDVNVNNIPDIPDYVFGKDYDLMPLSELSGYIQKNKHLPKIKSASEYEEAGSINLGELQLQLLEKVEELTLYTIQQQKEIDALKKENKILRKAISSK